QQYAPSHEVQVEEGGLLSALLPECSNFWVNSLHGQGAKVVSSWLRVEARSRDSLVEEVSIINHPFVLGVQWRQQWS
ncbi:gamma-glutamyl-gamma-aminobutyrate hydrolase family protein, partial [Escherichia coli]|uniref:gamma-glutamyl-gamma-aminobutyrate hydrolase family protein n=1 Tax=Escherichia coli TaxID=562 RepID=UPI0021CA62ED